VVAKIDWSEPGLPISVIAHAVVLVAGLVAFSSTPPFADAEEAVAADLISADQLNAMTKGEKTAKEVQPSPKPRVDKVAEVEQLKPTQGADPTDVPAPPARAKEISDAVSAPPMPPPRPPEPVKPIEKPEPPKAAVAPPKPEPPKEAELPKPPEKPQPSQAKPEPPKEAEKPKPPELKTSEIAQLLEQKKSEEPKPTKPPAKVKAEPDFSKTTNEIERLLISKEKPQSTGSVGAQLQKTAALGTQTGNAPKLSPSMLGQLRGLLQDQFYKCFEPPPGMQAALGVVPAVRIQFRGPDGALAGRPVLMNPSTDPGTRALSEAAVRAIARCAPYQIPAQFAPYFDEWRDTTFQIDLKNIMG
jgi:colicin import membrane protein